MKKLSRSSLVRSIFHTTSKSLALLETSRSIESVTDNSRARVQYELTQHPKLLKQLPGTLLELLQTALESSRYALKLNPENVDVLL